MHGINPIVRTTKAALCVGVLLGLSVVARGDDPPKITDYFALEQYVNTHDSGGLAGRQGGVKGALTASEQLALASNGLADAMGLLSQQMDIESVNNSEMEDRWQYVTSAFFGPARARLQAAEQAMLEKKQDISIGKGQRAAMRAFMDELDHRGRDCMVWKRGLVTLKECMDQDIKNFKGKNERFAKDIAEAAEILKKANELLARSDAKLKEVDDHISKVVIAARTLRTCGEQAKGIRDAITKNYGEKAPELDPKVKEALSAWKSPGDTFGALSSSLKDHLPKWSAKHQKTWDDAMAVRKDFDKAYGPVLSGKLFDDIASLKGLGYDELDKAAREVQVSLTARRMSLQGKAADEAAMRKALDEEQKTSAREKILYADYMAKWGASAERDIVLKGVALNSAEAARRVHLEAARMAPEKSADYVAAEMARMEAAESKLVGDWKAGKKIADAEYQKWWGERVKRREKLGLKPDWD